MSHVLVVEDSPDQARMIAGLLVSRGFTTDTAPDGADALKRMAARQPDIVVTDLIMPGLNGLELVEIVRKEYPLVPVILMTAFGSGEIAVRALRQGAASYVPKRLLQQELVGTIQSTLRLAQTEREQARVIDQIGEASYSFVLENDESLIPPLVGFIQNSVRERKKGYDENELIQLGIALQEALLNAMYHGNLEVDSALREQSGEFYVQMIERRRRDRPYGDRRVYFSAKITQTELSCVIRDEGAGFNPADVPDPTDPKNLEKVSGRGLYLIWTFMDEVKHNDVGNEITLRKRLASGGDGR